MENKFRKIPDSVYNPNSLESAIKRQRRHDLINPSNIEHPGRIGSDPEEKSYKDHCGEGGKLIEDRRKDESL